MKVVKITGKRECDLVERPTPTVKDNYALIRITAAPMCTEVGAYRNGDISDCLGHEAAGIVEEVGPTCRVRVGDRVVVMPQNGCGKCELCLAGEHIRCRSQRDPLAVCETTTGRATYAQYCIQQDWLLYPAPDDISMEHASMACCGLGPTFNAVRMMNVGALDTVVISGLGPVGMGGVVNAVIRGARVIGVESNAWRAEFARSLGASAVVDPTAPDAVDQVRELTEGRGADKSIEASSAETAPSFLVQATKINGEMTTVGWGGPIMARDLCARGVTVRAAWHWNHLRDADEMYRTIRSARRLLDVMITHRLPMSEVKRAWELQITGECGKIVLDPWR
jgi:threonine dehydrogenase-like Zn-dependent dehydrogenase